MQSPGLNRDTLLLMKEAITEEKAAYMQQLALVVYVACADAMRHGYP